MSGLLFSMGKACRTRSRSRTIASDPPYPRDMLRNTALGKHRIKPQKKPQMPNQNRNRNAKVSRPTLCNPVILLPPVYGSTPLSRC